MAGKSAKIALFVGAFIVLGSFEVYSTYFNRGGVERARSYEELTPREQLSDAGILGEHSLETDAVSWGQTGKVSGVFVLATGSVRGSLGAEPLVSFRWKGGEQKVLRSTLPTRKLEYQYTERDGYTIEFVFSQRWLDYNNEDAAPIARILVTGDDKENPNTLLMRDPGPLLKAVIRGKTDPLVHLLK